MAEKNYGNNSQLAELVGYISDKMKFPIMGAGGGFAPIGVINALMGTSAPQGWLVCDGHVYNISDYPELATFFASHFGASNHFGGDGTTTFAVPDLRGEFLRGSGTNSHANQGSGEDVGEHQDGTIHNTITYNTSNGVVSVYSDANYVGNVAEALKQDSYKSGGYCRDTSGSNDNKTRDNVVYTSRPTNTSVLFIIKATVSDAELNNMHVYSPNEHQVAWWQEEVDGVLKQKPVYEKRIDFTSIQNIDITSLNVDIDRFFFVDISIKYKSRYLAPMYYSTIDDRFNAYIDTDDGIEISFESSSNVSSNFNVGHIVIRYAKTTDQWQTV